MYRVKLINYKSVIATRLSSTIAPIEFLNNIMQVESILAVSLINAPVNL